MKPRRLFTVVAPLAVLASLSACTIGPDYRREPIDAPAHFRFAEENARAEVNTAWWRQMQDPVLDELIATALTDNKDLLIAAARVEEYYGRLGVSRSQFFPQIGAEAVGQRNRSSERTITPAPGTNPFNTVQIDAFASWEIDLFGRLRRQTEAARAQLLASEEGRRATILSLTATVATGYINLRSLDRQLEVARATLDSRTQSLDLFDKRFKGGVISELELSQARSEYATALAAVPDLERQVAQQENALAVLLGHNPGPIPRGQTIDSLALPQIPTGLPSELLEQRPDLRAAEQNLIAANAAIGAAKAQYFPSISLTGLFGGASTSLNNLFSGPGRVWSFAAGLSMPIFTAGAIAGQVEVAEAQQRQALLSYQKAIQTAFQEVDDALIGGTKSREQLAAQSQRVSALRSYARMARLRYEGGYSSYSDVLDAERSLFNAELSYAQVQGQNFAQMVALYKALGGGWVAEAAQYSVPPQVDVGSNPPLFP